MIVFVHKKDDVNMLRRLNFGIAEICIRVKSTLKGILIEFRKLEMSIHM